MLGRVLNTVLIPVWIVLVLLIFALALTYRVIMGVAKVVEWIGDLLADFTKAAIEIINDL